MNQDAPNESEGAIPPAEKKMRPAPATTPSKEVAKTKKGTLYITVGPQCSGKTTILKQIFGRSFHKNEEEVAASLTKEEASAAGVDITIDDQALVYIPVPTSYFLANSSDACATTAAYPALTDVIYGKMICERIYDEGNEELVSVARRLGGILSAEEFRTRLEGNSNSTQVGDARMARDDLVGVVEEMMQPQPSSKLETEEGGDIGQTAAISLPETIDLFVVESIFRLRPLSIIQRMSNEPTAPHGNATSSSSSKMSNEQTAPHQNSTSLSAETLSALDQALHLLKTHATNTQVHAASAPLSWGNTNTRPREFQSALEAASLSGRPVEFIAFGGKEPCEMIRDHVSRREYRRMDRDGKDGDAAADETSAEATNNKISDPAGEGGDCAEEQGLLCLPKVDRRTLLARNLRRFCQTGRYIPSSAIADAMVRVESLLASAAAEANKDHPKENEKGEKEANKIGTSSASEAAEADKECPKEDAESEKEADKISMSRAKFRLDFELAKMAGCRLNADRTVSATRQFSTHARNGNARDANRGSRNNNYQRGRGENRHRHQSGRHYGGRGCNHFNGRGGVRGRSNSHPPNNNHRNRSGQDYDGRGGGRGRSDYRSGQDRTYGRSGRGYDRSQEGRGNYNSRQGGSQSFNQSNGRGPGSGRGWDDRQSSWGGRSGRYGGRGRGRWGD